jgi:hypothetical protein
VLNRQAVVVTRHQRLQRITPWGAGRGHLTQGTVSWGACRSNGDAAAVAAVNRVGAAARPRCNSYRRCKAIV